MAKNEDFKKQIYGNPNWIDGRINRAEFITRVILLAITFKVCAIGGVFLYATGMMIPAILVGAFAVFIYWRIAMAYVKRCHDLGWTGWAVLPLILEEGDLLFSNETLIMVFNAIVVVLTLLLTFRKGTDGVNKYGKDPLTKYEENK